MDLNFVETYKRKNILKSSIMQAILGQHGGADLARGSRGIVKGETK